MKLPCLALLLLFATGCGSAQTSKPSGTEAASNSTASPAAEVVAASEKDAPPALTVGSPAPALKLGQFLKGEPLKSLEPGKIYVLEFWASWCGPCLEAMPHVSELQKQYPDVVFIGVNVWDDDESAATSVIAKVGEKLSYRVARDEIADGNADNGGMSTTWLKPAEINGIPTAIVVDGQGRIADITHPLSLDESLPQIIAGRWDYAAAAKRHLKETLENRE
jgi:thiol-disulfide isomerase/thioredoxin